MNRSPGKSRSPAIRRIPGKWWEIFGDPDLNTLEEKIDVSNQNVAAAAANFLAARALVKEARSQYYPTVSVGPVDHRLPAFAGAIRRNQGRRRVILVLVEFCFCGDFLCFLLAAV